MRLGVVEAGRDTRLQDMEREAELRERMLLTLEVAPRTTRIQLQPYRVARVHDEPAVAGRSETETSVVERSLGQRREPSAGLESPPVTATALGCARVRRSGAPSGISVPSTRARRRMPAPSGSRTPETLPPGGRVHVVGAGPVGLLLTALLQSMEGLSVRLYEKRHEYTRTRMVQLSPYLVADTVETYRTDAIDGDSVEAIFDPPEIGEGIAFRQSIPSDLMTLLRGWGLGFCPLNSIERELSDLIDRRTSTTVERTAAVVSAEDAMAMLEPGDVLIDCTGSRSLLRDHLVPGAGEGTTARTRSRSVSSTPSSSRSSTASSTTATSSASTTRTSRTPPTSSSRWSTARTTTAGSATSRAS